MVALAKIPAASFTGHGTPEADSISLFEKGLRFYLFLFYVYGFLPAQMSVYHVCSALEARRGQQIP